MDQPNTTSKELHIESDSGNPETILREIHERNEALDAKFNKLIEVIQQIRSEMMHGAESGLLRLSQAAADMMNGRVYQYIDIQAKGELGVLVRTFNQTLANLQQLDVSVKDQTNKVPEVAAQLDAITADTEMATQNVMNRLDVLMAKTEDAGRFFTELQKSADENKTWHERIFSEIYNFLDRAKNGEKTATLAQEILDYVFELQVSPKPKPIDVTEGQSIFQSVSDEAFEILNILQFQDITRQKIEKIIQLLKHFRQSLDRLLEIFKIKEEEEVEETTEEGDDVFKNRNVATQDNIFNTNVTANKDTGSIDDIIAQFKAHQ